MESVWRCFARINEILETDIFDPVHSIPPLRQSAFIELVICLHDLLKIAKKLDVRVSFTDAVDTERDIVDITDLIAHVRDAVCHVPSGSNVVPVMGSMPMLNTHYGKGALVQWREPGWEEGDKEYSLESDFDDDVCFFYGKFRIYLKRHIIRALDEVWQNLKSRLDEAGQGLS